MTMVPESDRVQALYKPEWLLQRLAGRLTADGDLVITSSRTRDQTRNREDARRKLAEVVRGALERPKQRRKTTTAAIAMVRRELTRYRSRSFP